MSVQIKSIGQLVKLAGPSLVPFSVTSIGYFIIWLNYDFFGSNVVSTILKCTPIFCLMAFLFFMGMKFTGEYRFHKRILFGLVFSAVGDAFLDYNHGALFELGMAGFAVAQLFYISAFGWTPFKFIRGLIIFALGGFAVSFLFPNFEGILLYGVPVYMTLLLTMAWRANARINSACNLPKLFAGLGGLFFAVSDGLIGFDKFYTPIQYSKIMIMVTYYVAQLGLSLSILDHEILTKKSTKSK